MSIIALKAYSLMVTLVPGMMLGAVLTDAQPQRPRFEEIDVERINVVERDGRLKMVLTNQERFPDGVLGGRLLLRTEKYPGIVFYNEEGDESGGLTFRSTQLPGGVEANASDRTFRLVQSLTVTRSF